MVGDLMLLAAERVFCELSCLVTGLWLSLRDPNVDVLRQSGEPLLFDDGVLEFLSRKVGPEPLPARSFRQVASSTAIFLVLSWRVWNFFLYVSSVILYMRRIVALTALCWSASS
jgi:hypothetical protein